MVANHAILAHWPLNVRLVVLEINEYLILPRGPGSPQRTQIGVAPVATAVAATATEPSSGEGDARAGTDTAGRRALNVAEGCLRDATQAVLQVHEITLPNFVPSTRRMLRGVD
jgi:hypothetical protein